MTKGHGHLFRIPAGCSPCEAGKKILYANLTNRIESSNTPECPKKPIARLGFATLERTGLLLVSSTCRGADPNSDVFVSWGGWDLDFIIIVRVACCGMTKACVLAMVTKRERNKANENLILKEQTGKKISRWMDSRFSKGLFYSTLLTRGTNKKSQLTRRVRG
jgi:hypothetical protein